jgi:IS5 family transposase
MLRVHCVQIFYNLSDPGMEDLLYESAPVRRFAGLKLLGPLPDETTILNFRHLLEQHSLGQGLLEEINANLESQGLRLREGTIVDATIIEAPSSTKNRTGERDPEMRQTKKGNQWHFGMKAHILRQAQDGGCGYRDSAQPEHHGGQCPRRDRGTQSAARRGDAGVV